MLQEFYTLLNFNFVMIYIIQKISVLLKNHLNHLKSSIFKCFFKKYNIHIYCEKFYSTYFEEHLQKTDFDNVHETEIKDFNSILTLHEKQDFSTSVSETSENLYLFVFIS